ncbi:hypothetical protein H6F32_16915 [Anabaena sp. FACHB-1237]|uniref:T3SS effector HopA1 family protein n=1 Tax=Anabaena sp. FACHB-1237 TaxID=2692769 RepID=UPI001680E6DA|nr:T3SS effector HopA1 family protein [Anabaena sp. FACHB-1237]MBD2139212.1 hypothetical protein [Anabaena sp. FACHB-1237]
MINYTTEKTFNSLLDIASNIQIEPNFCIYHPQYQPFTIPSNLANRFQQNPSSLQQKYLNLLLRNFLHGIYYNGALKTILSASNQHQAKFNFDIHSSLGVDTEFYQKLHNHNHGIGHYEPQWQVLRIEPDGSMAVTKNGLTLYIEPECHLRNRKNPAKVGELIAIWMPKNRLQNGYYIAVSNVGKAQESIENSDLGLGRIYFNFNPQGAISVMDKITKTLNKYTIPFSFQVLYNPNVYGRYDAGVLYFERENYPEIREILQVIYHENQQYFKPEIPLFTKYLAPGLGLAEEPHQKFAPQESFGVNRCQIMANALLESWEKGKNAIEEKMIIIQQHFQQHFIDLQHPYLNPDSVDIYHPL